MGALLSCLLCLFDTTTLVFAGFLLSSIIYSRLLLNTSRSGVQSSNFPSEPRFLPWENGIQRHFGTRGAHCSWVVTDSRHFWWLSLGKKNFRAHTVFPVPNYSWTKEMKSYSELYSVSVYVHVYLYVITLKLV